MHVLAVVHVVALTCVHVTGIGKDLIAHFVSVIFATLHNMMMPLCCTNLEGMVGHGEVQCS